MTPEKVRCIGCNSMVDARAVTNIATKEKPFKVCPQCAFIAGMYVVVQGREDKIFEPGARLICPESPRQSAKSSRKSI